MVDHDIVVTALNSVGPIALFVQMLSACVAVYVILVFIALIDPMIDMVRFPLYTRALHKGLQPTAPQWVLRMFLGRCFRLQRTSMSPFGTLELFGANADRLSYRLITVRARLFASGRQAEWTVIFQKVIAKAVALKERASVLQRVMATLTATEIERSRAAIRADFDVWEQEVRGLLEATRPTADMVALQFILGEKVSPIDFPTGARE